MSGPTPHPAALDEATLLKACQTSRSRASGPGGQHRNKVETAMELLHVPTGISGAASERRSQRDNQRVALFRLRINLALGVRCEYELGKPPSELWRSRCRGGRIAVNPQHQDFPAILAEALDFITALRFDMSRAATVLSCSASQLVKLLKDEPRALRWVNEQRGAMGLRKLL